jgi:hypothetical protein
MDNTDLALVLVAVGAGIVGGFVIWTYLAPMIAGTPAAPTAA